MPTHAPEIVSTVLLLLLVAVGAFLAVRRIVVSRRRHD